MRNIRADEPGYWKKESRGSNFLHTENKTPGEKSCKNNKPAA